MCISIGNTHWEPMFLDTYWKHRWTPIGKPSGSPLPFLCFIPRVIFIRLISILHSTRIAAVLAR